MQSISVRRRLRQVHIVLRAIVDIAQVQPLKDALAKALSYRLPICLHARDLERIDTAAVQTVLAFAFAARNQGLTLRLVGASQTLTNTWHNLGLPPLAEETNEK